MRESRVYALVGRLTSQLSNLDYHLVRALSAKRRLRNNGQAGLPNQRTTVATQTVLTAFDAGKRKIDTLDICRRMAYCPLASLSDYFSLAVATGEQVFYLAFQILICHQLIIKWRHFIHVGEGARKTRVKIPGQLNFLNT